MTTLSLAAGILPAQSLSRSQWEGGFSGEPRRLARCYDFIVTGVARTSLAQFWSTMESILFFTLILAFLMLSARFPRAAPQWHRARARSATATAGGPSSSVALHHDGRAPFL